MSKPFFGSLPLTENNHKIRGYTLLEAMVSLVLLCAVVVPLVYTVFRNAGLVDTAAELTGTWLVEQEAVLVRCFPAEALPVKRRTVDKSEWTLRTDVTDETLPRYRITAELRGRQRAEAVFYGRVKHEKP